MGKKFMGKSVFSRALYETNTSFLGFEPLSVSFQRGKCPSSKTLLWLLLITWSDCIGEVYSSHYLNEHPTLSGLSREEIMEEGYCWFVMAAGKPMPSLTTTILGLLVLDGLTICPVLVHDVFCLGLVVDCRPFFLLKVNLMDDGPPKLKIIPDHFQVPTASLESPESRTSSITEPGTDQSSRKLRTAFMLNLFSPRRLSWGSSTGGQEKVELTAAEVESLRTELADIEEREAHLKAQLEHIDEVLRSARLSGYLYIRTVLTACPTPRWAALPGEPAPIDDTEVDDRLPRFVVLHDLSPQDSTLLSDIIEVGSLPCFKQEDDEIQYAFYILTRHGLRYECSSSSKIQVDSWLSALQSECKLECDTFSKADCKPESDTSVPNGSTEM
ncbi:hypothetical protein V8G54_000961 [Vigna mungo]|uniref:PH domain-containing protein n=1 Tax=Vigna mungo TaxID=3915 RepID=A0AAQ3P825_VIGMU